MALTIFEMVAGALIGFLFGFVLQRGRFCMNSALRDPLTFKDYRSTKILGLALSVEAIFFAILAAAGVIIPSAKPLAWGANILGGFIFGVGMVLAGGCASGTGYRVGEGQTASFVALLGLGLGIYSIKNGALKPLLDVLTANSSVVQIGGSFWWIIALILGLAGTGLFIWKAILPEIKAKKEEEKVKLVDAVFKKGWSWWPTAIVVAIIATFAFIIYKTYALGITKGWLGVMDDILIFKDAETDLKFETWWFTWFVVFLVVGSFVAAKIAGEFKITVPKSGTEIIRAFVGGAFMGIGGGLAGGCNVGNLLTGVPLLSVGSIITSICFLLGNWAMAWFLYMRDDDD